MQLNQVIVVHKAGDRQSKEWADRASRQLQQRGANVLVGPSGPKDNPYPVFMASVTEPIDLAIVLGEMALPWRRHGIWLRRRFRFWRSMWGGIWGF